MRPSGNFCGRRRDAPRPITRPGPGSTAVPENARAGALVLSATLTRAGLPSAKDVQFTRLVGLPAPRT